MSSSLVKQAPSEGEDVLQAHAPPVRRTRWGRTLPGLLAAGLALPVLAQDRPPQAEAPRVYVEAGVAAQDTRTVNLGVTWPWSLDRPLWGGQLTGHWDAYVSQWRARSATQPGARSTLTQVAVVPMLRLRFDDGRSPWFVQGGIGMSATDARYRTPEKEFSTRFNFSDHLALGRNFGDRRQHELVLGLKHVSNAAIKKPNPGENFLQLRYGVAF